MSREPAPPAAVQAHWEPGSRLVVARLSGLIEVVHAHAWSSALARAVAAVPDGGAFALLLDLHGYEPADLDAHRAMREVVPRLLARHGMRPAFVDLFDEREEPVIGLDRQVRCIAFANVHHDAQKMARYRERIERVDQRFFTDAASARAWLLHVVENTSEAEARRGKNGAPPHPGDGP